MSSCYWQGFLWPKRTPLTSRQLRRKESKLTSAWELQPQVRNAAPKQADVSRKGKPHQRWRKCPVFPFLLGISTYRSTLGSFGLTLPLNRRQPQVEKETGGAQATGVNLRFLLSNIAWASSNCCVNNSPGNSWKEANYVTADPSQGITISRNMLWP